MENHVPPFTTLNRIREQEPCESGWATLLKHLGKTKADDEPLPFSVILESNGIEDALWCCQSAPEHEKEWRIFAVWCARSVQHMMVDERSLRAIDVAERHAFGLATDEELVVARDAARDAAQEAARVVAWDASRVAAWDAARVAAWHAARVAAWHAARDAAWAAARAAARDASWYATWGPALDAQAAAFARLLAGEDILADFKKEVELCLT